MKISSKAIPFLIPAILLFLGMLLSFSEFFIHAPTYLQAAFTTVKRPVKPDFTATDRLLKAVVVKGLIDYDKVKSTPLLNQALDELAAESPDHFEKKDDVLAYWINAHNVLSIKIQAGNYGDKRAPLRSPEFRTRRFVVAGQPTSVEQIWVDKLTPLFLPPQRTKGADPRAFLLLCRCSMGYPPMVDHAVTAETLSHDMADNTEKFLHDDGNVYYSREKDLLVISLLFRWYANIFSHDTVSPFIFVLDQIDPDIEEEPAFDYASQFDWRINAYRK